MPSQAAIIEAMLMSHFHAAQPINGSGDAAFAITYQFDGATPSDDFSGTAYLDVWSAAEKAAVAAALDHIETFLNVEFVPVTGSNDADLSLGRVSFPGATAGLGGASLATYLDGSFYDYDGFAVWDEAIDLTGDFNLILHELGHALGLDHPFDGVSLPADYDSNHFTVMSYDSDPLSGENNDAMMLYDLLALQEVWGAAGHNTGNTTYTGPRTDNVDVIWDTGGTDTLDASARTGHVTLDLRAARFSTFGTFEDVAIGYGVTIENAVGGRGDDRLIGNGTANDLTGNAGADLIKGGGGRDTLAGGSGGDKLRGGGANDTLSGGGGRDKIYGGVGADTLEGGRGLDKLWGDAGDDTFVFAAGSGTDYVRDFEDNGDTLRITGFGSRAEVLAAAEEAGGHTTFDFGGGDVLVVRNMTLDALDNDLIVA